MSSGAVELGLDRPLWILEEIQFVFIWDVQPSTNIENHKAGRFIPSERRRSISFSFCFCLLSHLLLLPLLLLLLALLTLGIIYSNVYRFPQMKTNMARKWCSETSSVCLRCFSAVRQTQISTEPTAWPPACLPVYLSVCLPAFLTACLSLCLSLAPESQLETGSCLAAALASIKMPDHPIIREIIHQESDQPD